MAYRQQIPVDLNYDITIESMFSVIKVTNFRTLGYFSLKIYF